MTDLRQAATLALDALTYIYTDTTADEDELIDQAITAIKEALAQPPLPEQEPVACRFCHSKKGCWTWQCYHCGEIDDVQKPAPLPVQEPVAYDKTEMNSFVIDLYDKKMQEGKHGHYEIMFHVVHQAIKRVTLPLPVQEPLEYWNAVEGWVKIDEMREHFDSVNCGTIYKHGGEGRVPLYTAPPQRQWDKPSASFNEWWNGDYEDPANPFEKDSAAYWAWAGWKAAQRPWVGLTEEYLEQIDTEEIYGVVGNHMAIAMAVEAVLKEKNG